MVKELSLLSNETLAAALENQYRRAVEQVLIDLEQKGLLGKHQMRAVQPLQGEVKGGVVGKIRGSIFAIHGAIYGETETVPSLSFSWERNPKDPMGIFSSIPVNRLYPQKTEQSQLTVSFQFNLPHFIRLDPEALFNHPEQAIFTIRYPHPNDYINPEAIQLVILEGNEESLKKLEAQLFGQTLSEK